MSENNIAIIGSGPSGIYTFAGLLASPAPLSITVFEVEADAGKGTPYHPNMNDQAMLANIASVELPPVAESLTQWLRALSDLELERLGVLRANIHEREFYPRLVLGEYFQSQFTRLIENAVQRGHKVEVKPLHRVTDIKLRSDDIQLTARGPTGEHKEYAFKNVVMATGHNWPETTEVKPGYFISPWPAAMLKAVKPKPVGILGTSLSAIDALITVATAHGSFLLDSAGVLQYFGAIGSESFQATMMSRKGILPEADFYCDYPYSPLQYCTHQAVNDLLREKNINLLDQLFELFRLELVVCDPAYAAKIGLAHLDVDTFGSAYFADRANADPFVWAARNLAEADKNKSEKYIVQWRYAILRMHEVIARAIPFLDDKDLRRFQKHFKSVFVDDYATVPHQSIQRMLALRRAGKLDVLKLGNDYEISTRGVERGAVVKVGTDTYQFNSFIDATGQSTMSADDLPFPSLVQQGLVRPAATREEALVITSTFEEEFTRTGGIDLDAAFRPQFEVPLCNRLYCAAISFLLHKMPFVQGITSAHEIGNVVSKAILTDILHTEGGPKFEVGSAVG